MSLEGIWMSVAQPARKKRAMYSACRNPVVGESLESRLLLAHFAITGDFSSDLQTQPTIDVSNMIKGWNPDFIVSVGDNNYPDGDAATIDANCGQYYHDYIFPYTGSYGAASPSGNRFWSA